MPLQCGLYLLSHSDLRARPDRSERALRVFFPTQAEAYLAALQRGEEVLARRGEHDALSLLAGNLFSQGFRTEIRPLSA